MTCKKCPACQGSGQDTELLHRIVESHHGGWMISVSTCVCCRGRGYILFDEMYPTAKQFQESYRQWMETEIIPETEAHIERMKSAVYQKKLEEVVSKHTDRLIRERHALICRMDKALKKAVAEVRRERPAKGETKTQRSL